MSRRTLHDEYFRRAKADGYAARSAYKLIQIQESKRLMKRGDRVLDLGCAPGAWLQVAARVVGTSGSVVGLDLKPVSVSAGPNVVALVGDAFEIEPSALTEPAGGAFDCVVSDMAPNTTGHGDSERSVELCRRVLELLPGLLKPTGSLAMKVFEGRAVPRPSGGDEGDLRERQGLQAQGQPRRVPGDVRRRERLLPDPLSGRAPGQKWPRAPGSPEARAGRVSAISRIL